MISVEEALHIIKANTPQLEAGIIELSRALNATLAENVYSKIDMPPFRQSAMDGYALNFKEGVTTYVLKGEVKAGQQDWIELTPGEAVRIFTGAPVPETATSVIQQEWVIPAKDKIEFSQPIKNGLNIRPKGEQIQKEDLGLAKGTRLHAAGIGFLASLGVNRVNVFRQPKIAIVATGDELVEPQHELAYGQIYESNAIMLETAMRKSHYENITVFKLKDDYNQTLTALTSIIKEHDVVFVSGGISVGDYDFVGKAFNEIGVQEHFYKVKQKPGKPLFFGSINKKMIFGLPGNPASSLTCFYIYGLPCLNQLTGGDFSGLTQFQAPLKDAYIKKGTRAEFLKAHFSNNQVEILSNQSSAMLNSFALSNALVYIPEEKEMVDKNEVVKLYLIG